jgi:hypothetical protein
MPVNEITASRTEYALALTTAGIKVSAIIPERIVPPVVIISPGSPYLEPTTVADGWIMRLELMVVAMTAVNVKATESLEKALEALILANPDYARIQSIGQPYALQTNNTEFLAANVSVDIRITI